MKRGKQVCRILKDMRRQIADVNDIEFVTAGCQHQGDSLLGISLGRSILPAMAFESKRNNLQAVQKTDILIHTVQPPDTLMSEEEP